MMKAEAEKGIMACLFSYYGTPGPGLLPTLGSLPKLGEIAGLSHIQEREVFVPSLTPLPLQTALFAFLPQSKGCIQTQTPELCSRGTGRLVGGHHSHFVLFMSLKKKKGEVWQCSAFKASIIQQN